MTPQENQALQDFLNQLTQVRGIPKDPQAEAMISSAVSQQPDAAYLLVQRAMLLDQALNGAKAQIAQLQNELQSRQSSGAGGFLDSATAWGRSATGAPQPAPASPAYTQNPAPMQNAAPAARPGFLGGGGGSFLGNMAATAAGVAGGAFLFQGIENLLGHHQQGSGLLDQSNLHGLQSEPASLSDNSSADTDSTLSDGTDLGDVDVDYDDSGDGESTI